MYMNESQIYLFNHCLQAFTTTLLRNTTLSLMSDLTFKQKIDIRAAFIRGRREQKNVSYKKICQKLNITGTSNQAKVKTFKTNLTMGASRKTWVPVRFECAVLKNVIPKRLQQKLENLFDNLDELSTEPVNLGDTVYGSDIGSSYGDTYDIIDETMHGLDEFLPLVKQLVRSFLFEKGGSNAEEILEKFDNDNLPQSANLNVYHGGQQTGIAKHRDSDSIYATALFVWNESSSGPLHVTHHPRASRSTSSDLLLLDPNVTHSVPVEFRYSSRFSIQVMF